MIDHLCLDYVPLRSQYQQLLRIRDQWRGLWAKLGQHDGIEEEGTGVQHDENWHEQFFEALLLKFKKLVVASRP